MSRDPFWITDLHGGRHLEIGDPLSDEADAFIAEVHPLGTSAKPGDGRRVECRAHDDDERLRDFRDEHGHVRGIWMYVRRVGVRWVLCHHPFDRADVDLGAHIVGGPVDPDHQRYMDTWAEAYELGGCDEVRQEVRVGSRVYDVMARLGDRTFVAEVDHTTQGTRTAKAKERKDIRAGVTATIFCADVIRPPYEDRVPYVSAVAIGSRSQKLSPRALNVARGPRIVTFEYCRPGQFTRCPDKPAREPGYRWCGQQHPRLTAWNDSREGLTAADLGELVPAGELVVARPRMQGIDACLVNAADGRALNDYLAQHVPAPRRDPDAEAGSHRRVVTAEQMRRRSESAQPVVADGDMLDQRMKAADRLADGPGIMRARWWSVCRGCDVRVDAGEIVALCDMDDGHRAWVCASCAVRLDPGLVAP